MQQTTITIQGKPFTYNDEVDDIGYANIDEIPEEEAHKLLEITKKLFAERGLFFCLAYGTLLGAVRDHGIIKGDEDVDVLTDNEDALRNSLPYLDQHGLHVCRITPGSLYSFKYDSEYYIDVYIRREFKKTTLWHLWCYNILGAAIPRTCFKEYELIDFVGGQYCAPANPEKVLEAWYGKTWRTPVRGHNQWIEGVPAQYYWRNNVKPFVSRIIKTVLLWNLWHK